MATRPLSPRTLDAFYMAHACHRTHQITHSQTGTGLRRRHGFFVSLPNGRPDDIKFVSIILFFCFCAIACELKYWMRQSPSLVFHVRPKMIDKFMCGRRAFGVRTARTFRKLKVFTCHIFTFHPTTTTKLTGAKSNAYDETYFSHS